MTLNYTIFQGIGIIGIVGIVGVIGGSIFFSPSPVSWNLGGMVFVSLVITYFLVFWILPSHRLLKGLKKEHPKKCWFWHLLMIFNAIFLFLFYKFIEMLMNIR